MYIDNYLKRLRLNAIIFDDDILEDIDCPETIKYIFSLEFLNDLNFRISLSTLIEDLDCHVINNIKEVLNYIRFNGVNKEYISIINDILVRLNTMGSKGSSTFYKTQRLKREGIFSINNLEKHDLELYTDERNKDYLCTLRDYICLDHDLLDTLLNGNDKEFHDIISEYVIDEFLGAINIVSYECTAMFENKQFKERVLYVLKHPNLLEGKKNISDFYKTYKLQRRVKKVI